MEKTFTGPEVTHMTMWIDGLAQRCPECRGKITPARIHTAVRNLATGTTPFRGERFVRACHTCEYEQPLREPDCIAVLAQIPLPLPV